MAITVNDSIQNNSPKSLDNKYTKFVSGSSSPYSSVSDANSTILSAYRSIGLTVLIDDSGSNVEYWYKDGVADIDLVKKTVTVSQIALDNLQDVNIGSPADGEVLTYNGSSWVNEAPIPQNFSVASDGTTGLEIWRDVSDTLHLSRLNQGTNVTLTREADQSITISSTGGGTWGSITGTLSSQTDLQTALDTKITQGGNSLGGDMTIGTNDGLAGAGYKVILESGDSEVARFYKNGSGTKFFCFGTVNEPVADGGGVTSTVNIVGGLQCNNRILATNYYGLGTDASSSARFGIADNTRAGCYFPSTGAIFRGTVSTTGTPFTFSTAQVAAGKIWSAGTYLYSFPITFTGSNISTSSTGRGFTINPNIDFSSATNGMDEVILFSVNPTITNLTGGISPKTATVTAIEAVTGLTKLRSVSLTSAGDKISIATGSNASVGTSTLMAGTVTVSTTAVTSSSKIFMTRNTPGGTTGQLSTPTGSIVDGTSFVINSDNAADTSTVNWWIIN